MPATGEASQPLEYTPMEWMKHYAFRARRSGEVEPTTLQQEVAQMFARQYPDALERRYKQQRFEAGMTYLDRHLGNFAQFVVEGSQESGNLISKHLIFAIYILYCQASDEQLNEDFPESLVVAIAKKSKT